MEVRSDSDSSDSAKMSLLNGRSSGTSAIPCTSAMRVEAYKQLRISVDVKVAFSRHYRFSKEA